MSTKERLSIKENKLYWAHETIHTLDGQEADVDQEGLPILLFFHGRGGIPCAPDGVYVRLGAYRLLMPKGFYPVDDDSKPNNEGYAWFPFRVALEHGEKLLEEILGNTATLHQRLVAYLDEIRCHRKMVVAGFSQGGIMALSMALRYPELFSHCIAMAARLPESEGIHELVQRSIETQIHLLHGESDPYIPFSAAQFAFQKITGAGIQASLESFPCGHEVSREMEGCYERLLEKALKS